MAKEREGLIQSPLAAVGNIAIKIALVHHKYTTSHQGGPSALTTVIVSNWGFTAETLVATYKATVRPILNYATPIWFTQESSTHLDKLEVIPPLRATLMASYHCILRGLRVGGDDPNARPLIFGSVLEEGAYPLARPLLRGRMIEKIVRFQAPSKVLMATLPSFDPAKQLLPHTSHGSGPRGYVG